MHAKESFSVLKTIKYTWKNDLVCSKKFSVFQRIVFLNNQLARLKNNLARYID